MIQAHPSLAPEIDFKTVFQRLENHAQAREEIRTVRDTRSSYWDLKKTPLEPDVAQCRGLLVELKTVLEDLWNAHQPSPTGQ